jgi:predicted amidophosphoribosyltransferase
MKIKCWSCGTSVDLSETTCGICGKKYVTKQRCGDKLYDTVVLHIDTSSEQMTRIREYFRSVAPVAG